MCARNVVLVVALFSVPFGGYAEDIAQPEFLQYHVKMELYRVLEDAWASRAPKNRLLRQGHDGEIVGESEGLAIGQFADSGKGTLKIGNSKVEILDDHSVWNGEDNPADPSIILLSRPSVMTSAGVPFEVRIDEPSVEYFRPAGPDKPGLYVHGVSDPLGVTVLLTVSEATPGNVELGTSLRTRLLARRMELPGVSLEVGLPVISQREMSGKLVVPSDKWSSISMPAGVEQGGLLLLLKVSGVTARTRREGATPESSPEQEGANR